VERRLENLAAHGLGAASAGLGAFRSHNVGSDAVDRLGGWVGSGRGGGTKTGGADDNTGKADVRFAETVLKNPIDEAQKRVLVDAFCNHNNLVAASGSNESTALLYNANADNVSLTELFDQCFFDGILKSGYFSSDVTTSQLNRGRDFKVDNGAGNGSGGGGGQGRGVGDDFSVRVVSLLLVKFTVLFSPFALVTRLPNVVDAGIVVVACAAISSGPGLEVGAAIERLGGNSGGGGSNAVITEHLVFGRRTSLDLEGLAEVALEAGKITPATPALHNTAGSRRVGVRKLKVG
jgi:hypothetical protein